MLFKEMQAGDSLKIGDVILTLEHKTGSRARFAISTEDEKSVAFIPKAEKLLDNKDLPGLASAGQIG